MIHYITTVTQYSYSLYELVLGTRWFGYELELGTSWLGYELARYDLVRVQVDRHPVELYFGTSNLNRVQAATPTAAIPTNASEKAQLTLTLTLTITLTLILTLIHCITHLEMAE